MADQKKEWHGGGRVLCLLRPPPTLLDCLDQMLPSFSYFLAAGIATIKTLKPIQCSVVLSQPQTSRTRKADCRCAGEPRTPRVAHMVGTPFGVPEVRFLLRAFTAAEAAFGHSRSCGSGERWNDPVLPNRARPPNWWHMPGQRALDAVGQCPWFWPRLAHQGAISSTGHISALIHLLLLEPLLTPTKSTWVVRVWVG